MDFLEMRSARKLLERYKIRYVEKRDVLLVPHLRILGDVMISDRITYEEAIKKAKAGK